MRLTIVNYASWASNLTLLGYEWRYYKHRYFVLATGKSSCTTNIRAKKTGCCPKTEQWKQVSASVGRALKLTIEY
jgi:hypothetical protein